MTKANAAGAAWVAIMTDLPIFPVHVPSLLIDTQQLSSEEFGCYCRLLCVMWVRGGTLPENDREMARLTGTDMRRWHKIKAILMPFLMRMADGSLSQKRLQEERKKAVLFRAKQKRKSAARWRAQKNAKSKENNDVSDAAGMPARIKESSIEDSSIYSYSNTPRGTPRGMPKNTKSKNPMIQEIDRRLNELRGQQEDKANGHEYVFLPPDRHH